MNRAATKYETQRDHDMREPMKECVLFSKSVDRTDLTPCSSRQVITMQSSIQAQLPSTHCSRTNCLAISAASTTASSFLGSVRLCI